MSVLIVTSLAKGDGKTAFCAGLAMAMRQRGTQTTVVKAASFSAAEDQDSRFYASLGYAGARELPVTVSADEGISPASRERVVQRVKSLRDGASLVIVEGPPLYHSGQPVVGVRELVEALGGKSVLIMRYDKALRAADVERAAQAVGGSLLGVVINSIPQYRRHHWETGLAAELAAGEVSVLGALPEERTLLGVTVAQLAEHLHGQIILNEDRKEQLVDHLMIGGMILDWGVYYFSQSETKAVIVRGDRPDIQMAALHTPTRCLVLTGGHPPLQYVAHEAREEEVPIVLVQPGTLDTAKASETLFDQATIHHQEKVERFAQVLARTVDIGALAAGVE